MKYSNMALGEIASFRYGKMPNKKMISENGKYPIYSGYRVTGYYDEYNLEKDELVIVARGVGGTGDVKLSPSRCYLTNLSIAIKVNENFALKKYLYYYFAIRNLRYLDSGSAQSQITISNLEKVIIPLPNIEIQRKLVIVLSTIDNKIELNQKINDNLERQAQAIFENSFIDNPENTAWKVGTFSELIISTINGDWGKEEPTGNNTEKVYCIRGADIPEVKVGNKGKMPTRYILPKNLSSKKLEAGDIVIEISGGSPTQSTGRCAAITQSLLERYDSSMVCTNFCKAIKPKLGYSLFVYFYWQYLYQKDVFFSYENGTTGIKNLDFAGVVETEQIIIPPIDKIANFNNFCASLLDQIFANGKQNEQLASLRDSLLPKLMSGELDVSEIEL